MPGVLFEGGSFRPVFSCGVMDALLDNDVMFPYCIGVSAGAADSASYISKQRGRNIEILEKYRNDKRYMGKRNFIRDKSIFGIEFVFRKLPNELEPFDMNTFQAYDGKYVVVTTDAETGKVHYFEKEDIDERFDVYCATCALPGAFPAIEINGHRYYDGGLSNPIPIDKCIEDGNEKMLIVLTQPEGFVKKCRDSERRMSKLIRHKYPAIADELLNRCNKYNESMKICEQLERDGKAVIIRPEESLNSFESDVTVLRQSWQKGYDLTVDRMTDIEKLFK